MSFYMSYTEIKVDFNNGENYSSEEEFSDRDEASNSESDEDEDDVSDDEIQNISGTNNVN